MMNKRSFMTVLIRGGMMFSLSKLFTAGSAMAAEVIKKIRKTEAEWKKMLTPEQYEVVREEGTEYPFSSPLNNEKRHGTFTCVACDLPLFSSKAKFDSGTGWPSFYDALPGALETKTDTKLGMVRTEYHCTRCGAHHGHLFEDGPKPTGLRYCSNGVALKFIADKT
jgi:peptide-methionine (R)-S-oxide reductase